jgi:hypothetical protein
MPSTFDLTLLHVLSLCGIGNARNFGPYPTTCTILVQGPVEVLEMPSTLDLTLLRVLSLCGIGNAHNLGPYPTILVQGPLEGSVMPSTLGLGRCTILVVNLT